MKSTLTPSLVPRLQFSAAIMIQWPAENRLGKGARWGLARFCETSAAAELVQSAHRWQLEATSWTEDYPIRLIWRNERGGELCVILEERAPWWIDAGSVAM